MSDEEQGGGDGSSPSDPLTGRTILGRYRLGRRLGSGGMGAVYEAEQLAVGRTVAVKVLRSDLTSHPEVRDRFRREAEIIGRLRHPHTIALIDYGETEDGLVVMVTELLLGQPLDVLLAERGGLSLVETLTIGAQVAASLVEAHALGLVHRDLKPANVFVTWVSGEPFCKVLDFGIARVMDEGATRLTSTGQIFGTPRYMSPEQAASTSDVDHRSDLYSLGLILFECATGTSPFQAQTAIQYLAAHSTQVPPKLRDLRPDAPEELEGLVVQLLNKLPEERPADAEVVRQTLGALRARVRGGTTEAVFTPDASAATAPTQKRLSRRGAEVAPAGEGAAMAATVRRGHPFGSVALLALGAAGLLAVAAVGVGLRGLGQGPVASRSEPLVTAQLGPDVGRPDHGPVPLADGGGARGAVPTETELSDLDAGSRSGPDAKRRPRRRTRPKRPGIVSGPRGMEVDLSEPVVDRAALAERCRHSQWSGLSRLDTRGCPPDLPILVDDLCAGRTPAQGREITPGPHEVVIYRDGKPYRQATIDFRAGQTGTLSCR